MKNKKINISFVVIATFAMTIFLMVSCQSGSAATTVTAGTTASETTSASATTTTQAITQGNAASVVMQNTTFVPSSITVSVGTTVTWTNQDSFAHTVESGVRGASDAGSLFKSGDLNQGGTFSLTFTTAGTYPYFCSVHPGMDGTVIVK